MSSSRSAWFSECLPILLDKQPLTDSQIQQAIRSLVLEDFDEVEAASFLVALRMKGETSAEIASAVRVLREQMIPLQSSRSPVLDTCGTGGDESHTFNVSTAVALVVGACGVPVVKHGNRSVSSRSGSADVLQELGIPIQKGPEWAKNCLEQYGFGFCFAPHFHPTLAKVAPIRKKLGIRTIFNLLGPLLNPAHAEYQLLGVGKMELLDPLAYALRDLGIRRAMLVCSYDGLDEVSISAPTAIRFVRAQQVESLTWTPEDFELAPQSLDSCRVGDTKESAATLLRIFHGERGTPRYLVLVNASVALFTAEKVTTFQEGIQLAAQAIDSGKVLQLLQSLQST